MPFLKFSRDKRGYENYYLFEGKGRPRLLFWFRTPPQVKVGRAPFSDDVRKMVEAQNPGMTFDWPRIMATPIPPPDVDYWRERRRAEKAAKRAAREPDVEAEVAAEAVADVDEAEKETAAVAQEATADRADAEAVVEAVERAEGAAPATSPIAASDVQSAQPHRHRRRRRRRRGRRGPGGSPEPVTDVTQPQSEPPAEPEAPSNDEV